jgi:hypothetical protein
LVYASEVSVPRAGPHRDIGAEIALARARLEQLERLSSKCPPSPSTAYRDLDPSSELEELHARAASLAIEHAILRSMVEREQELRRHARARLVAPIGVALVGGLIFAATRNFGVLLCYAAIVGKAVTFTRLVGAISPGRG